MPRKNKRKNKPGAKTLEAGWNVSQDARNGWQGNLAVAFPHTLSNMNSRLCLTLKADGITQCGQLATDGHPDPNRCRVHHGQFRILYEKYKDAEKVVDDLRKEADLLTKKQISCYTDWHAALEKAHWARKYLEVIRVEKRGREIHEKRFFLKVDDTHRHRLKLLEEEMMRAVGILDALCKRACELYKGTLPGMKDLALSQIEDEWVKKSRRSDKQLVECTLYPFVFTSGCFAIPHFIKPISELGDEDLINMSLRDQKEKMISLLKVLISCASCIRAGVEGGGHEPPKTEFKHALLEDSYQQLARRIIFYEPSLFMKSLERVSIEDFILNTDLSMEDLIRFLDVFLQPMGFALKWFKDAIWDVFAASHDSTAAESGGAKTRIPFLGGYIFNHTGTAIIPNEVWGYLLMIFRPPADTESCFVRLCNNFEDLVGFLSFEALGLVPSPSFCQSRPQFDANDPALSRNHLSLSGVIVADMSSIHVPPELHGPLPTIYRARQRGYIVWSEMEPRAYMFGAVRNERDEFVDAFIRELRARPDLFQVVLRSDTAPGRRVDMFGSGASNDQALPLLRSRQFEAPPWPSPPSAPPSANDGWKVEYSALDVLYGLKGEFKGYLTNNMQKQEGAFFRFKTFPVTYFVILDTVPYRDRSVLARNVAWASLRAGGYAVGEYTVHKYAAAADRLVKKCAKERLEWVPEEMKWKIPMMQDQMSWCSVM